MALGTFQRLPLPRSVCVCVNVCLSVTTGPFIRSWPSSTSGLRLHAGCLRKDRHLLLFAYAFPTVVCVLIVKACFLLPLTSRSYSPLHLLSSYFTALPLLHSPAPRAHADFCMFLRIVDMVKQKHNPALC